MEIKNFNDVHLYFDSTKGVVMKAILLKLFTFVATVGLLVSIVLLGLAKGGIMITSGGAIFWCFVLFNSFAFPAIVIILADGIADYYESLMDVLGNLPKWWKLYVLGILGIAVLSYSLLDTNVPGDGVSSIKGVERVIENHGVIVRVISQDEYGRIQVAYQNNIKIYFLIMESIALLFIVAGTRSQNSGR